MSEIHPDPVHRRAFLQGGAVAATGLALAGRPSAAQDQEQQQQANVLPMRKLGRTGIDVSILNQGTWQNPALDRLVRFSYAKGVRYFDAAKSYGSEPGLKRWFQAMPEVRKQIFLVTKDTPNTPRQLIKQLEERCEALGVDYVDMIFIHALGDHGEEQGLEWPKSKEFKETAEAIRKSGRAKFVGFSTHHKRRAEFLQAAADGGFVDGIMLQYTPWLDKDSALNKAIDACHKAGIGLISMKQVAAVDGQAILKEVQRRMPDLKEKGMSAYQGLLHAIWTDERIASVCVSMRNTDQINENTAAARSYEPMKQADLDRLRDAWLASGPTLCADCDGRCARAAGTTASLGDLTRFLTYHEHHGDRSLARRAYAALAPHERDWSGADLEAARAACPSKLDFAKLMPQVDRHLA